MSPSRRLRVLILNPMTGAAGNVVRDVLYGCWCAGKRIGGASLPPFTLLQVAAVLNGDGCRATFLDAQAEQTPLERVKALAGDFDLALMATASMSFTEDAAILLELKRANPKLATCVFGAHPTFMPEYALAAPGVDYIARFEPEYVLRDLARSLAAGEDPSGLPGLGSKGPDGAVRVNPQRPFIKDLDELPWPDASLLPKGVDYFNPIVRRMPYMTVSTSRGCPGKCVFCTAPAFDGHTVRFMSAGAVLAMMRSYAGQGFKEIYFRDDTFFVNKVRDREICETLAAERLDLTWLANARVSHIDRDMMRLARKAGCHTLKFGIESGDQAVLDGMRKGYRMERALEVFAHAREVGLDTHAHVMIGNPGDTLETVERTIGFVKRLAPTTASFGICSPYPGTPLFESLAERCPELRDATATDLGKLHVEGLFNAMYCSVPTEMLSGLVRRAYREFYLRPSVAVRLARSHMRSLADVRRVLLAGSRVLDFAMRKGKT